MEIVDLIDLLIQYTYQCICRNIVYHTLESWQKPQEGLATNDLFRTRMTYIYLWTGANKA